MMRNFGHGILALALLGVCSVAMAQGKSSRDRSMSKSQAERVESADQKSTKSTGRLPRYFASIVDNAQRLEIYEIQASYRDKIVDLEKQLQELKQSEQTAIEDVLTSTQRKKLSELRSTAKRSIAKSTSTRKADSPKTDPAKD